MRAYALALSVVYLVCAQLQRVAARSHLSSDRAVARAAQFCRQIGTPTTAPGAAQYPSPERHGHWKPRWQVVFGTEAAVEVVDAWGMIASYLHTPVRRRSDDRPAGPAMPKDRAISIGQAVVKASGCDEQLRLKDAVEAQQNVPPSVSGHYWYVTWERMFQGIPFRAPQTTDVCLNAETGEVIWFNNRFLTPPPAAAVVRLTQQRASAVADACLQASGRRAVETPVARQEVVQPNGVWQGGTDADTLPISRVAWTFRYRTNVGDTCEVWVDAEVGAVIGGFVFRTAGPPPKGKTAPDK